MAIKYDISTMESIRKYPDPDCSSRNVLHISLEKLKPFEDHPFKPYEEQRLYDLIRSIEANGVLNPILVRKIEDKNYEILSGHNRVNAARECGLDKIPAIICEPENDEEVWRIVVESNFNQRSIKDMKPSELAKSLYRLNEAMKKPSGHRSDIQTQKIGSQSDNRFRTMQVIGEMHDLSQATIARFIRIAQLYDDLLDCLDNRVIGLGVAEHLSYLRPREQEIVYQFVTKGTKVSLRQARALKRESMERELNEGEIRQLLTTEQPVPKTKTFKLSEELYLQYFTQDQPPEEVERVIAEALELYKSQNSL